MDGSRRWRRGLIALGIGILLSMAAALLSVQAVSATGLTWTQWLQNVANFTKVVEIAVFIFSGYQFWGGTARAKGSRRRGGCAVAHRLHLSSLASHQQRAG